MNVQRIHNSKPDYFTAWLMGLVTFLTSILISLVYHYTVVPLIERLEMMSSVTGILVFVPLDLQLCFCLLFIAGLGAILGVCLWRKASLTLILLGSLPMLEVLLLYAIPQVSGDLHRTWNSIYLADRSLFLVPPVLLLTSYLFFILSIIVLIRKFWLQRCEVVYL